MFIWHKIIRCLDLPAQRVLRLQRSLTEVQVALPGIEPQEACAYVCAYAEGKGVRIAVVLHCLTDGLLAFYLNEDGEVGQQDCGRVFNQGIDFAETMGFLMADTDIHTLQDGERIALWESLPLKDGVSHPPVETVELETEEEVEVLEPEELPSVEVEIPSPSPADFISLKPAEVEPAVEGAAAERAAAERAAAEKAAAEKAAAEKAAAEKPAEIRERSVLEGIGRLLASL